MGIQNKLRGLITSVKVNPDSILRVSLIVDVYVKNKSELKRVVREFMDIRDSGNQIIIEADENSSTR